MSTVESPQGQEQTHEVATHSKRPREEGDEAETKIEDSTATSSTRPPPLKMLSSEALDPKAPAPMVRIKSRASLSSPTTPSIATAVGLKISSPSASAAPPALKILSPTTRSPLSGSGPRFGSPTDRAPKSPARYSSFSNSANNSSAASAAISQDPRERYSTLFHRLLTQTSDGSFDETKVKEASMAVAEALMGLTETVRVERTKSLLHHLSDPKNKNLRIAVREGNISGAELVSLDPKKLMNPEKQQEVQTKIEWSEKDRDLTELANAKKISSTMYECPKCKKRDCTFYEKQTRSADEPMTQFINCNVCKYNWKIY